MVSNGTPPPIFPCFCPRCRADTQEVVVGQVWKLTSPFGQHEAYADVKNKVAVLRELAKKDRTSTLAIQETPLLEGTRVSGKTLCVRCQLQMEMIRKVVADGGVAFTCAQCGAVGALRPDSKISRMTREAAIKKGITTNYFDPRITLTFKSCSEHPQLDDDRVQQ